MSNFVISDTLPLLKQDLISSDYTGYFEITDYYRYLGYAEHFDDDPVIAKAHAIEKVFVLHEKHIYDNDLVAGSMRGCFSEKYSAEELAYASKIANNYGKNTFWTNVDHDAIDYGSVLSFGVNGIISKINASMEKHSDLKKLLFLQSAHITMNAFSEMIRGYAEAARIKAEVTGKENLYEIARICDKVSREKPETFHEALQLVWLIHVSFLYENRYAMALGRLDQYLYPFYLNDNISEEQAKELISCTLYKIYERNIITSHIHNTGQDDVVNIVIGGVKRDGSDAVNELSYIILDAVKECKVPGPNLSARVSNKNPDEFIDKCLEVIGTGIGYPALMNDEVNIAALERYGYKPEDCNDYCMVGCIENFLPGKQPPWSDGRFNSPKYLELALNNGRCMLSNVQRGPETGDAENFKSMDEFLSAVKTQMQHGASEYVRVFNNDASRYNHDLYSQPYLSCYHDDCIVRGLDVRNGGSVYPSIHGAASMGIATFTDSLTAIEKVVYDDNVISLSTLRDVLKNNFEDNDDIRSILLKMPKYGNNDAYADKYAQWFVDTHYEIFSGYKTFDGGGFYLAIASNIDNIPAGKEIAATPDGRMSMQPLSDAASPGHGMDINGITSVLLSCSKPDFTKVACGSVLNIKFAGSIFEQKNIAKLRSLVRVYFERGGQEMQINCVSREDLIHATNNPDLYKNLVVRVSGFSAFYVDLSNEVQMDILERTEH